ncbi:MAG: translational GTPase TypA [Planctomycetota bacterium]|nr:translational GTPase TypA [Planctomycetota bacterium]
MKIRNIAIIAHVDHGKTTLVDALLADAGVFREGQDRVDCVLDSNELERERGITVLSKNVAVVRGDLKINIIDTPGHSDFGGEVERVLRMADGALLLVDAYEGPMPQTRYVLGKALEEGLTVVVVVNKCDRPAARPHEVVDEVFDLFAELGADDEQLDFRVLFASGRDGWVRTEPDGSEMDTTQLFSLVEEVVPSPRTAGDGPARLQVSSVDHNNFVGRIAIGRIDRGVVKRGASLASSRPGEPSKPGRVADLFVFEGLERRSVESASAGDIVAVQGYPDIAIGETLCDPNSIEPLPVVCIDEPTLSMEFMVNDSPFNGQEGKLVTGRQIGDRLSRELRSNVALRVEGEGGESVFRVSGRGVLHLGILVETMRREGFELALSRPRVIDKVVDGQRMEPVESLTVDVPGDLAGRVIEGVSNRGGELEDMDTSKPIARLLFVIPARGLIGLRSRLLTLTQGEAALHHIFRGYEPFKGRVARRSVGVMVSTHKGKVAAYALDALRDRGDFFVKPAMSVYEGMIVGEHCRAGDISVNATREKKLTNMRTSGTDRALKYAPPRELALEEALEYIEDDELVEVTPASIRLRKRILNATDRKRLHRATESSSA